LYGTPSGNNFLKTLPTRSKPKSISLG